VEALRLPDSWVGAGFVRNPVWAALHGRSWSAYVDGPIGVTDSRSAILGMRVALRIASGLRSST